ncbi:MAG: hypothetical protein ABF643_04220 [Oenococcus oeni]
MFTTKDYLNTREKFNSRHFLSRKQLKTANKYFSCVFQNPILPISPQNKLILIDLKKQFWLLGAARKFSLNTFWHEYGHITEALRLNYTFVMLILPDTCGGTTIFSPDYKNGNLSTIKRIHINHKLKVGGNAISLYFDSTCGPTDHIFNFRTVALGGINKDIKRQAVAQNRGSVSISIASSRFKTDDLIRIGFGLSHHYKRYNDQFFFFKASKRKVRKFNRRNKKLYNALKSQSCYCWLKYKLCRSGSLKYCTYVRLYKKVHS